MNNSLLKVEKSLLKTESRTVKLRTKPLHEEITLQQEIIITVEENNERLYRQMRALMQRNNELLDIISDMQQETDKLREENKLLQTPKDAETDLGNGRVMKNGVIIEREEGNTSFDFV